MLALLGILATSHAESEPAVITADRMAVSAGSLAADGNVQVEGWGSQITCDTLQVNGDHDGMSYFAATGVRWTPCECDKPPWAVRAKQAEGRVGEYLSLQNASLEVCGLSVIPLPGVRVPLNKRTTRLLFPEVGNGLYGPRVGLPIWLPVARESALVLTPEYRFEQAFRQRAEWSGPAGKLGVELADDHRTGGARGQVRAAGGTDNGTQRLAIDSQWVTDDQYLADYGDDYFSRTTPFSEHLLVAATGPIRLESNTFDRGPYQRPLGVVFSMAGESIGPVAVHAQTRLDLAEIEVAENRQQEQRGELFLSMLMGQRFGIVEGQIGMDTKAVQWSDGGPWSQARSTASMMVPAWGRMGQMTHIAEMGWMGSLATDHGALEDRFGWARQAPPWQHGPQVRSTLVGRGGVPVSSEFGLFHTGSGWRPVLASQTSIKRISARLQADPLLQLARVGYGDATFTAGGGVLRTADLLQSMADVGLQVGPEIRISWHGLFDHNQETWLRHGPSMVWSSRCNCLSLKIGAEWAEDREIPDGTVRLDLRPKRLGDSR